MSSLHTFLRTPTMDDQGSPVEEDARNSVGMGLELISSENAVKDQARIWQCTWLDGQCWSTLAFAVLEDCLSVTHGSRIARREYWRPLTSGTYSCSWTRLPIYTGIRHPSMTAEDAVGESVSRILGLSQIFSPEGCSTVRPETGS
jgi:hypothetical protein